MPSRHRQSWYVSHYSCDVPKITLHVIDWAHRLGDNRASARHGKRVSRISYITVWPLGPRTSCSNWSGLYLPDIDLKEWWCWVDLSLLILTSENTMNLFGCHTLQPSWSPKLMLLCIFQVLGICSHPPWLPWFPCCLSILCHTPDRRSGLAEAHISRSCGLIITVTMEPQPFVNKIFLYTVPLCLLGFHLDLQKEGVMDYMSATLAGRVFSVSCVIYECV